MKAELYCDIHPLTLLVCPRCIAAKGGKTTAARHTHAELSKWGRMGGRPRKKKKGKPPARKKKS